MIFLDNNSTTKTDIRVVEKMIPFFTDKYGNSSSKSHKFGWEANDAIFNARKQISNLINCNPDEIILEQLKDLPFDYYQIYDSKPSYVKKIKEKYNKKIISVVTVSNKDDVDNYKQYENISDIILFDSKGYHKSVSFNHDYLDKVITKLPLMIAGDIKIDDLAKQVIRLSGLEPIKDIQIKYTGLKQGEKLYEKLYANDEEKIKEGMQGYFLVNSNKTNKIDASTILEELESLCVQDNNNIRNDLFKVFEKK